MTLPSGVPVFNEPDTTGLYRGEYRGTELIWGFNPTQTETTMDTPITGVAQVSNIEVVSPAPTGDLPVSIKTLFAQDGNTDGLYVTANGIAYNSLQGIVADSFDFVIPAGDLAAMDNPFFIEATFGEGLVVRKQVDKAGFQIDFDLPAVAGAINDAQLLQVFGGAPGATQVFSVGEEHLSVVDTGGGVMALQMLLQPNSTGSTQYKSFHDLPMLDSTKRLIIEQTITFSEHAYPGQTYWDAGGQYFVGKFGLGAGARNDGTTNGGTTSGGTTGSAPELTDPAPGAQLAGKDVTLNWTDNGVVVTEWYIRIGTAADIEAYVQGIRIEDGSVTSVDVSGLPDDGSEVLVQLSYQSGGSNWNIQTFAYTAFDAGASDYATGGNTNPALWSARLGLYGPNAPESPWVTKHEPTLSAYVYAKSLGIQHHVKTDVVIMPSAEHVVRMEIVPNTPGAADGALFLYVDGVLKAQRLSVEWMDGTFRFDGIFADIFFGGNSALYSPHSDVWVQLRDMSVRQ